METKSGRKLIIGGPVNFYASDFDDGLTKVSRFNYPCSRDEDRYPLYVHGASAGLILLFSMGRRYESEDELILWNPTTQQCRKLPACPGVTNRYDFRTCGLGYDSAADDYTVVVFSYVSNKDNYTGIHQVWIFSLKSNSWRSQDVPFDGANKITGRPAGFMNGALYWQSGIEHQAYGFDIANEKLFTFPDFLSFQVQGGLIFHAFLTPLELEGYLLGSECREGVQDFYLFVSEDGGRRGEGNWRKAFRCNWSEVFRFEKHVWVNLLAHSQEGDCLLTQHNEDFYWYNFKDETRKKVKLMGLPELPSPQEFFYDSFVCFESLVSLDNEGTFSV